MSFSGLKSLAVLPGCCAVRRTSLAAGTVTALFTGGLPFVGFEPGLVMGRTVFLPSPLAFAIHLGVAIVYGALFCLAISRSRDGWTAIAALVGTLTLYAANLAMTHAWNIPRLLPETDALLAHFFFGASFTVFFKLAEIGGSETAPLPARR